MMMAIAVVGMSVLAVLAVALGAVCVMDLFGGRGRPQGAPVREEWSGTLDEWEEAWGYAPNHPLWRVMMAVMRESREQCVDVIKNPKLTDRELHMATGGVETLDTLMEELEEQATIASRRRNHTQDEEG